MSITTRRAGSHETGQLHDLAARTFGLACPPGTLPADIEAFVAAHLSTESFAGYLAEPGRIILLVEADGVPIGYSMLVRGPIKDPDVAAVVDAAVSIELSKFYLSPDRHGTGAAAALMAATLRAAAATGAAFCWLGVNQQNARAGKFYTRQGFEIVGTKRFLVGAQWHEDHVRRRPLGSDLVGAQGEPG
ncbi:GNAT family N-acetyltransferase [Micromonosporaceae bacterium Da 78-11]